MAPRSFWKGYLKLSLVTCPVAMLPAVSEGDKLRFHTVNRATGHRVQARYVDAETGKPVADADEVKGYPRGDDDHVMLEDDELDAVALDSTRTIDIDMFVPRETIAWIWYDTPHFLVPDDKVGEEAFAVIREAMRVTGVVGISRLVLYRRERAVMLEPRDRGIVLWTLRYGDEVRDATTYFTGIEPEKADAAAKRAMASLIEQRTQPWTAEMMRDPVQEKLLELIAAKRKAGKRAGRRAGRADNVIDLTEALRRSLAGRSG